MTGSTEKVALANEKKLGEALSQRIGSLRRARQLSLDALSTSAGLSKGTVVALEQGKANPSIGVLCRLAAALSISVTDLLEGKVVETAEPIQRCDAHVLWNTKRGSEARLEASTSGQTMFEIWSWKIAPGDNYSSDPHGLGTVELISVRTGTLQLKVGDFEMLIGAGESVRLVGDRPHSYAAAGRRLVSFSMAVLER